jgi:hypothetical protein
MDTVTAAFDGVSVAFSCLLFLFVPGFALSLVIFPRRTDLSYIDRLVYSVMLSISTSIAALVFVDMVPGFGLAWENVALVVLVFSALLLMVWVVELWYRERVHRRTEPQDQKDPHAIERFNSRALNAAHDLFRQDTRTTVIYHESVRSGSYHIDHAYLLDVGEEIAIQQVSENKLNLKDSFILEPPYPLTRYFELTIREYTGDGLSQVDDLQIYPVLVAQDPPGDVPAPLRDSLHITERIYQKTTSAEVQWIYSHDFHIFAIIHEEDTPDHMVYRILEKLDEIVTSTKSGITVAPAEDDLQVMRYAFDTVMKKPGGTPSQMVELPGLSETRPGPRPTAIPKRPVILSDARPSVIPPREEDRAGSGPREAPEQPPLPAVVEPPAEVPPHPVFPKRALAREFSKPLRVQPRDHPKEPSRRTEIPPHVPPAEVPEPPGIPPGGDRDEIPPGAEFPTEVLPADLPEPPVFRPAAGPAGIAIGKAAEVPPHPVARAARDEPARIPVRQDVRPRFPSKKPLTSPENKLVVDSIKKLQKDILRDLDMFGLTPDTFKKSGKNIENIPIPKKADVKKKLSDAEKEILDLEWLYE